MWVLCQSVKQNKKSVGPVHRVLCCINHVDPYLGMLKEVVVFYYEEIYIDMYMH